MRGLTTEGQVGAYEGLVIRTAEMFFQRLRLEREDLEQELRLKVLKARRSYDPSRSSMTEKAYVYALLANLIKDLKRDAARRANGRLEVSYIEDYGDFESENPYAGFSWFEFHFCQASHEQVYGPIEEGFVMPATVTPEEEEVILLLVVGYAQTEIAATLGLEYAEVVKRMRTLRAKLADWRPTALGAVEAPHDAGTLASVRAAA